MEADEIRLVLERASELHAKISEAIERALKSEFMRTTCSRMFDSSLSSVSDAGEKDGYGRFGGDCGKASTGGDQNVEARALGLIRDALETLEDQLEALQVFCSVLTTVFFTLHFLSCETCVSRLSVFWNFTGDFSCIMSEQVHFSCFVGVLESLFIFPIT